MAVLRRLILGLVLCAAPLSACGGGGESSQEGAAPQQRRAAPAESDPGADGTNDGWPQSELASGFAERIVLVTVDTLRADVLGYSGRDDAATPTFDRLAREGVYFSRAHAHNVMTLPSHANILTGRLPYEHGVRDNAGFRLDPRWPTVATLLRSEGFATAAVIGAFPLDARFGLDAGFDLYDDRVSEGSETSSYMMAERRGDVVVERGLRWWRAQRGKRFLWLHLFDPHAPYAAEARFARSHPGDAYQGEVSAVDAYLAPLVEQLRADGDDATLLVVTSDHGEALGEHGEKTHGLFAYEPTLRVPLLLWSPSLPGRGHDRREARHVDLLPTMLDAAGVAAPTGLPGASLLRPAPAAASTYFEALGPNINRGWAPLRGVLEDGEKFISLPIPELYDLDSDPDESENLVGQRTDSVRALRRQLPEESQWPPSGRTDLSADEERQLRSLGYLSGAASGKATYTAEDDPKNLVHVDDLAHRFVVAYQRRDLDEAVGLARQLVEERPSMGLGYYHLAQALLDRGDTGEALEVMGTAYRRQLATPGLRRQLALTLTESGRALEALQVLDSAPDGGDPDTLNVRGLVLAEAGRHQEAVRTLRRVFEHDPRNPEAHQNLARAALLREDWSAVVESARAALELNDALPLAWNYLGVALYNQRQPSAALDAWRRAVELAPSDFDLLYNLAIVSAEQGRLDEARRALRRFVDEAPPERYGPDITAARRRLEQLPR